MNGLIKVIFAFCFVWTLTFSPLSNQAIAGFPSMVDKIENQTIGIEEESLNNGFDELLGPEDNFPFLPDNHRDGSNPIGRIGKISSEVS